MLGRELQAQLGAMDEIAKIQDEVMESVRRRDYDRALRLCNEIIAENPRLSDGFRERAFVHGHMGRMEDAIRDSTRAIELDQKEHDFEEPADYFRRGYDHIAMGAYEEAIRDFSKVIDLCEKYSNRYYAEAAYQHRAYAHLQNGAYRKAIEDCHCFEYALPVHIDKGLITRQDILNEAEARLRHDPER